MKTTPPASTEEATGKTRREIFLVLAVVMVGMLLPAFNVMAVSTALPAIVGDLGGLSQLSWIVTAYLLTATVSVPLYGKISDLYGRRLLFQIAIWVFIAGSLLSGLSQSVEQLILFRAVQGLGGGGLMALSQAIIGDAIPPRQRGRYQGYIGMVFALASIAGPLFGGFFADQLSWRWIFFVSLPLGLLAIGVAWRYLHLPHERTEHRIDFLGAALLTFVVSSVLLVSVWGGVTYPWSSPVIIGLGIGAAVALAFFIPVERRASEPIIPFELFRERVFTIGTLLGFIVGTTMFGSIIFVPLFLQAVIGVSATHSGLLLLPLMLGIVSATTISGRLITRWGRYKVFPVLGTGLMTVGFALLSSMGPATSLYQASAYMLTLGLAIGMVMQTLVLAIQNAIDPRHMGIATSTAQFFRMIGGTVGVAAFGALLNVQVARRLSGALEGDVELRAVVDDPTRISELPVRLQEPLQAALSEAVTFIFLLASIIAAIAFAVSWLLRELPLRDSMPAASRQR